MYFLLLVFLTLHPAENKQKIHQAYEWQLAQQNKSQFYTVETWNALCETEKKVIRNILILKHAEIRYAPIDQLRLKVFNAFVERINQASLSCPKPIIPSNPLYYWNIDINKKFLKDPLAGGSCFSGLPSGCVYGISKNSTLEIPYLKSQYNNSTQSLDFTTNEAYILETNALRIKNGDAACYLPLNKVHSICILEKPRFEGGHRIGPENSSGLLITLNNSMQVVWDRSTASLVPVGFINQKQQESDYEYCNRMHNSLFRLHQPVHFFDRFSFKTFIWQTPQWWYWTRLKLASVIGTLFVGGAYWSIKRMLQEIQTLIAEETAFRMAMETFEKQLSEHSIKIPEIILSRLS